MHLSPFSIDFSCHDSMPNCSVYTQPPTFLQSRSLPVGGYVVNSKFVTSSSPGLCILQDGYLGQCPALRRGPQLYSFSEPNLCVGSWLNGQKNASKTGLDFSRLVLKSVGTALRRCFY